MKRKKLNANYHLAFENYKELNTIFYRDFNSNHFETKVLELMIILSDPDNYLEKIDGKDIKFSKTTITNIKNEKETLVNYAKTELVNTYYHCIETFMRLFISHATLNQCPWLEIISLSISNYKNIVNDISNNIFSFIPCDKNIDEIIEIILTGKVKNDDTYVSKVKNWISYSAMELCDVKEYNSFKHGLVNFNNSGYMKIENEKGVLEKHGDSVNTLKIKEKEKRYVYTLDTTFIDYDEIILKIHIFSEMINNILKIGKCHYINQTDVEIKGLIAGTKEYSEIRDLLSNEEDKNNLGRLLSKYSIELLYYKDGDENE